MVLDIRPLAAYTEFVVVCSGSSDRQVAALAQSIDKSMNQAGVKCRGVEGKESGRWVLMDYGDVVVHVFYDPIRHLYDIEGLWPDAETVKVPGYDRKRDVGYAQFA